MTVTPPRRKGTTTGAPALARRTEPSSTAQQKVDTDPFSTPKPLKTRSITNVEQLLPSPITPGEGLQQTLAALGLDLDKTAAPASTARDNKHRTRNSSNASISTIIDSTDLIQGLKEHPAISISPLPSPSPTPPPTTRLPSKRPRAQKSYAYSSPSDSEESSFSDNNNDSDSEPVSAPPRKYGKGKIRCEFRMEGGQGVCGKTFSRRAELNRHLKIHNNQKDYQCDECGKAFVQKAALTVHARTHSGEKPYGCSYCSQTFVDSSSLRRHERTHGDGAAYKCHKCSKAFTRRATLGKHLDREHGEVLTERHSLKFAITEGSVLASEEGKGACKVAKRRGRPRSYKRKIDSESEEEESEPEWGTEPDVEVEMESSPDETPIIMIKPEPLSPTLDSSSMHIDSPVKPFFNIDLLSSTISTDATFINSDSFEFQQDSDTETTRFFDEPMVPLTDLPHFSTINSNNDPEPTFEYNPFPTLFTPSQEIYSEFLHQDEDVPLFDPLAYIQGLFQTESLSVPVSPARLCSTQASPARGLFGVGNGNGRAVWSR